MRRFYRFALGLAACLPLAGGALILVLGLGDAERAQLQSKSLGYIEKVLPELSALAIEGKAPTADPALQRASTTLDPILGTAGSSAALLLLKAEIAKGAHPATARHAAAGLVARIGAASGLDGNDSEAAKQLRAATNAAAMAPLARALLEASRYSAPAPAASVTRIREVLEEFTATASLPQGRAGEGFSREARTYAEKIADGIGALAGSRSAAAFDWGGLDAAQTGFQRSALDLGLAASRQLGVSVTRQGQEAQARGWLAALLGAGLSLVMAAATFWLLRPSGIPVIKNISLSSPAGMSGAARPVSRGTLGAIMGKTSAGAGGGLRLTTAISAMVFVSVVVAISAVLFGVYLMLAGNTRDTVSQRLNADLRIAAAILEVNLPNSDIYWNDAGELDRIEAKAMPKFRNHNLIDTIGRVTGDTATLFVLDEETQEFVRKTTTILDADGERILDTTLAKDGPAYPVVSQGQPYLGDAEFVGTAYYAIYYPVVNLDKQVIGLVYVGIPKAEIDGVASQGLTMLALVGAIAVVAIGALSVFAATRLMRPIPRLSRSMQQVAAGDLETEIPYVTLRNEIGEMARNVEVFRANALKVQEMTEDERLALEQRRIERADMIQSLQRSFGEVVDAATEGDFSRRVEASFTDAELNRLAGSVNRLVETVDSIFADAGTALAAIANTDLTYRMNGHYGGSLGKLCDDTNHVADRLTEMVSTLKQASGTLKSATAEILSGSNDLSDRTTRQAATIEETSAAMLQLAGTVRANAQKAEDARNVAGEVTRSAEEGGAVMHQANLAMERISASSSKISNIIGMIDDIAFQTNLLALNASVEAARAGEAGKGFAVVAVEVRRLAQSAAQASSEVKTLIEQSGAEVTAGTRLVAQAADKLDAMMSAARQSNTLMAAIAEESHHQAGAIDEVNAAVRQLDQMTQHNAALVEEINAAIEQTEAQAGEVDGIADTFTVASAQGRRAA